LSLLLSSSLLLSLPSSTPDTHPLPLPDALPISSWHSITAWKLSPQAGPRAQSPFMAPLTASSGHPPIQNLGKLPASMSSTSKRRSEEHTSELQSRFDLVCRLLLEKKKNNNHEKK